MTNAVAKKTGFQPGNTAGVGNAGPKGRAQKRMCTQVLISILNEPGKPTQFAGDQKSKLYEVLDSLVDNARAGDIVAQKYVIDRIDGTPTQMIGEDPDVPVRRPVFFVNSVGGDVSIAVQNNVVASGDKDEE